MSIEQHYMTADLIERRSCFEILHLSATRNMCGQRFPAGR